MEQQQEERKMKVYGREEDGSNSSFPLDLVSEILLKLPVKSILRSRCVSKLWSSITTNPYFINSFETRSSSKPNLLIFFKKIDKLVVFSFPQHHQKSYSSQHVGRFQMTCPKDLGLLFSKYVHGLILFRIRETPVIWNPTTRRMLTLPRPENNMKTGTVLLGYDPIEAKHKVVYMAGDECWVVTLGSSSSWRRIETNLYHSPSNHKYQDWQCINGVLYLIQYYQRVLTSFDVRSETFQQITIPLIYIMPLLMIAYQGRLALVNYSNIGHGITLRVLENAKKEEWLEKSFRAPDIIFNQEYKLKLRGVNDAGEFIYVPTSFLNSFCIWYFDPKKDSFRKVKFEGIADEEFRLGNGLGNRRFDTLVAFPNHMDSLISL